MTSMGTRKLLQFDAMTCFATGLLLTLGRSFLTELLGLNGQLLLSAGVFLILFAIFLLIVSRIADPTGPTWLIITVNALWVAGSIGLLTMAKPTVLGLAFVLAQAAVVGVIALLQLRSVRKPA